jgi:3-oxoacyl-[acyl-carrier-protein] synthase II
MPGFVAVISGMGLITPAGIGVRDNWARVVEAGETMASALDVPGLPNAIACEVPGYSAEDLGVANAWQFDRYSQFALVAVHEALREAGLKPRSWPDSSRVAVVIGSGAGGTATLEAQYKVLAEEGAPTVSPLTLPMGLLNMAAGQVAIAIGANGPCLAPCTACASGVTAIGIARDMLRLGTADIVVAGGAEAPVTPLYLAAFTRMRALTRRTDLKTSSRPFDVSRDGFVLGEGAGIVVMETEEHARARGVSPIASVIGYGASADAHHVTSPDPQGRGAKLAMRAALSDGGLPGTEVGYVNAHGTSTRLNDSVEAAALNEVCGESVMVSSTKGVTGHLLGAAGAIETAYTALALRDGVVPPTANLTDPDPAFSVDLVVGKPRRRDVGFALSNSFGFGGQNASVVLAAPEASRDGPRDQPRH